METKYGYLCEPDYSAADYAGELLRNKMDGLFLIEPNPREETRRLADSLRAAGLDLILAFTDYPPGPYRLPGKTRRIRWRPQWPQFDFDRLARALECTNRIALGSSPTEEWGGYRNDVALARIYREFAKAQGYEWVCTLGYGELVKDLRALALRPFLVDVSCVCLCGHILAGYAFADPKIPNQGHKPGGAPWGSFTGRNLHKEYGLTAVALRHYLDGMNVISGVGYQEGLDAGARVYLRALGFSGFVSGFPIDLDGTDAPEVCAEPDTPPPALGLPKGYCAP